jgi:hypothetical protein
VPQQKMLLQLLETVTLLPWIQVSFLRPKGNSQVKRLQ